MQHQGTFYPNGNRVVEQGAKVPVHLILSHQVVIGFILAVALVAFEIFNFDTTQYALSNLLGEVSFAGIRWATILALAFCAIDFAGLAHLFTPEKGAKDPKETWYLMGAWLLGATMNALMTWWAINLTLLNQNFGNEVLSREQLLNVVPVFVAVLVWLTRILFIGAFSIAGEQVFRRAEVSGEKQLPARFPLQSKTSPHTQPLRVQPQPTTSQRTSRWELPQVTEEVPAFLQRNPQTANEPAPTPVTSLPNQLNRQRNRRPAPSMPPPISQNVPATVYASSPRRETRETMK